MQRLNPKLTKRRPVSATSTSDAASSPSNEEKPSSGDREVPSKAVKFRTEDGNENEIENSFDDAEFDEDSDDVDDEGDGENPRAHLHHTQKWVPGVYVANRRVEDTGVWACCGSTNKGSLYCESVELREIYARSLTEKAIEATKREERMRRIRETIREPWLRGERINQVDTTVDDTTDFGPSKGEQALAEAQSMHSASNIPMLVTWVQQNIPEEPTSTRGLRFFLKHAETGEGCAVLMSNDAIDVVYMVQDYYKSYPEIQLLVLQVFAKLLECNYTRESLVSDVEALRLTFSIGHRFMNSLPHVEACMRCIVQCARSEVCRADIMERRLIGYCTNFCKRYSRESNVVRYVLKLFNWVSTTTERMVTVYKMSAVDTTLRCMQRHTTNADVLGPAMSFLTRAASMVPACMDMILERKAVSMIIKALRSLYASEELQIAALKMLQTISKSSEGWKQISETPGGWQSICTGTTIGDQLVHDLKGELNNPGWCIGETPHLPLLERMKLLAAKAAQSKTKTGPKNLWTCAKLQEYMGSTAKVQRLAINVDYQEAYFELLQTLDMLPEVDEERETWFHRMLSFETESKISLDEMVHAILQIKKREQAKANAQKDQSELDDAGEVAKQVFVMGQQVTAKMLEERDMDAKEQLQGIV